VIPTTEKINFAKNQISGSIPENLTFVMTNLRHLELQSNVLEGKVPSFQRMTALKSISLGENHLSGSIFKSISNLKHLEYLDLRFFEFSSRAILSSIEALGQLKVLNLQSSTYSESLSNGFGNLTSLQVFDIGGSFLSGTIPETIRHLTNLGKSHGYGTLILPRNVCRHLQSKIFHNLLSFKKYF
jgi:hypothetical protein